METLWRETAPDGDPKRNRDSVLALAAERDPRELRVEEVADGILRQAARGLPDIDLNRVRDQVRRDLPADPATDPRYLLEVLELSVAAFVERDPAYSTMAARLLHRRLTGEVLVNLGMDAAIPETVEGLHEVPAEVYGRAFRRCLVVGVKAGRLDPQVVDRYDVSALQAALRPARDERYDLHGLRTLYDRYLLRDEHALLELPQVFCMRVAMGLAAQEDNPTARAVEFYDLLSEQDFMCSTPTLFNAATPRAQMSSCFLSTVPDSLEGVFKALSDNAMLSKFSGGLGNDWTPVRSLGSRIKGTNGESQGVVPFLKVANSTTVAVNQGGRRKGAACAYLESWHGDVEAFQDLRRNTGDDRQRTHDMNTCNWIPDLFMERVRDGGTWTLLSPSDAPDLHDLTGTAFRTRYEHYEREVAAGRLAGRRLPALNLWRSMLTRLFETGHPWITFKDACNLRSPQQHDGVVHSSNLCTEITLNTSENEVAVCNLGSVNLVRHLTSEGELDEARLRRTVRTAMRMLDNVIDINHYTIPETAHSNARHRPVGLGIMGLQDVLHIRRLPFASPAAVEFGDRLMELIAHAAIEASSDLAAERGTYASFAGSLWSQGELPLDSLARLDAARGTPVHVPRTSHLDWEPLRAKVRAQGMRNSNVMAIAPTATIANICGVSPSIEPTFRNLYVKSNMSGEFTVINRYLVEDLKARGLWTDVVRDRLKAADGDLEAVPGIPPDLRELYRTVWNIEPEWLVDAAARRGKWIDQSQSLNLYMRGTSGARLHALYLRAWETGLKTTYYLRTLSATRVEKSTMDGTDGQLNAVPATGGLPHGAGEACRIGDDECEACQ